ncbi:MAG: hypothetical protein ACLSVD_14860, partial [Eggerthellaceae bacterium]
GGVGFYRFLKQLLASFDERAEEVSARLADLAVRLFADDALTLSFTGTDDDYERFLAAGAALGRTRPEDGVRLIAPDPVALNEAFIVPTDVCYAAQGFDRRAFDAGYTGAWQVAARALSYDYLWNEVRVKGGAYGPSRRRAPAICALLVSRPAPRRHAGPLRQGFRWLAVRPRRRGDGRLRGEHRGRVRHPLARPRARQDATFGGRTPEPCRHARPDDRRGRRCARWPGPSPRAMNAVCVFGSKDIIRPDAGLAVIDLLNDSPRRKQSASTAARRRRPPRRPFARNRDGASRRSRTEAGMATMHRIRKRAGSARIAALLWCRAFCDQHSVERNPRASQRSPESSNSMHYATNPCRMLARRPLPGKP